RVDDDRPRAGRIEDLRADAFEETPGAIFVAEPAFVRYALLVAAEQAGHEPREPDAVVRRQELEDVPADELLGLVAENALARRTLVAEHAVGADDRGQIGGVLDQRTEVLLAALDLAEERRACERRRAHRPEQHGLLRDLLVEPILARRVADQET